MTPVYESIMTIRKRQAAGYKNESFENKIIKKL